MLDTTSCDKVCQLLEAGRWFPPITPVSSTNNTNHQDIAETPSNKHKNPNDFYYALNLFQRIFLVPMNILNAPKDIVWPHD